MTVLSLPASLVPVRQRWQEERQDIEFRSVFGSQILQPVPPVWATELEFDDRADWLAGDIKALQMLLAGGNQLEAYDMARPAPLGTMRGTLTLAADVAQGAVSMQLTKPTTNLMTQPTYNPATWRDPDASGIGFTQGIDAPDGSATAVRASFVAATGSNRIIRVNPSVGGYSNLTGDHNASFYARLISAGSGSTVVSADIQDKAGGKQFYSSLVLNQWARVTGITANFAGTTFSFVDLMNNNSFAGIIDFWGLKLEPGLNPTAYGHGDTLLAGDLLGIGSGTKQQVVMVTQDATSTGQGNITVNFEHPLRNAFSAGQAVTWDKPKALFRIRQNRPGWDCERSRAKGLKLDLVESVYA